MTDLLDEPDDATPISADEREGLIPSHITLRSELNELEQQNILEAVSWAEQRKRDPVSESFGQNLHKRMFGQVWKWAGTYRTTEKSVGIDPFFISPKLAEAYEQFRYWVEHKTLPPDELAARFHHALVFIHPFPNGNGRWSRLMADILLAQLGQPPFTWGRSSLRDNDQTRKTYIAALKRADQHDVAPLLAFVRS